ncbi:MAG: glycolate oxidase subunit GlcE [Gammaproteobacteria bacterium]|nr:glycolate oxidase subunit GlcE [Gammaproteobacteria bacterium]
MYMSVRKNSLSWTDSNGYMMSEEKWQDTSSQLIETVSDAYHHNKQLNITGGGSKSFLGSPGTSVEDSIITTSHCGVLLYEPKELVLQARCGTPIAEIEKLLSDEAQMLGFEPPHFGDCATVGGAVASGLSGPMRPYAGAARDFVLGVNLINGKGEQISFGGRVMKNVAGYDVSRLMVGAMGTLGLIMDVSLKVIPLPRHEITCCFEMQPDAALNKMLGLSRVSLPVTGTCYFDHMLYVRLAGNEASVRAARKSLGGEEYDQGKLFWRNLRDQDMNFYSQEDIWRLSVSPSTPIDTGTPYLIEWGGAQRWYQRLDREKAEQLAENGSGHATLFRTSSSEAARFHPLSPELAEIHKRLKYAFDPGRVFNPGRMYADI